MAIDFAGTGRISAPLKGSIVAFNENKVSVMFADVVLSHNFDNREQMQTQHLSYSAQEGRQPPSD